jgi:hypothetical protein
MTKPIVGSIVYSNNTGLGVMARDFYENGLIDRVIIQPTDKEPIIQDRFHDLIVYPQGDLEGFLKDIDILLILEQYLPYAYGWKGISQYYTLDKIKEIGKRIVLIPMHECTHPGYYQYADCVICPSLLEFDLCEQLCPKTPHVFIPVPAPHNIEWVLRTKAQIFTHNAGYCSNFRNGTKEILEAMQYVDSPILLSIRAQGGRPELEHLIMTHAQHDIRIIPQIGELSESDLYVGDVFLFPEKYNGSSLPIQEAFSAGMPIMAGDRYPINTWLPKELLIPVTSYDSMGDGAVVYQSANISPKDLAKMVDLWYNKDISNLSLQGKAWAEENSWKKLKPVYEKYIYG